MAERLRRHAMVTVAPAAWAALMAARPDLAAEPLVAGWAGAGHPLIVRRPACSDAAGQIPLGLPLPPAQGKRRIAVTLAPADVADAGGPPLLADAAAAAPPGWRDFIARLVALDPGTRVFGSLAWQHLTGLPYLSEGSDLDLLWRLPADVDALLAGIAAVAQDAPMRIDGEITGAAGGVQWRELAETGPGDVAVKGLREIVLMPRADFLAGGAE
jgi:phosphoribosyl-dephospho-CoA transferase